MIGHLHASCRRTQEGVHRLAQASAGHEHQRDAREHGQVCDRRVGAEDQQAARKQRVVAARDQSGTHPHGRAAMLQDLAHRPHVAQARAVRRKADQDHAQERQAGSAQMTPRGFTATVGPRFWGGKQTRQTRTTWWTAKACRIRQRPLPCRARGHTGPAVSCWPRGPPAPRCC